MLFEKKWFSTWYSLLLIYIANLLILLMIRIFIIEPFNIKDREKTLAMKSSEIYVLVTKPLYRYVNLLLDKDVSFPSKGQIVVYKWEKLKGWQNLISENFISRVIACSGDIVELKNSTVYINGVDYCSNISIADKQRNLIHIIDGENMYKNPSFSMVIPEGKVC